MKCFKYAIKGISATLKTQRNMRVHLCFAFYVTLAGFVTGLNPVEWAAVLICMGLVTALECLNTAIETFCDELHPQISTGIGRAKDAAAGAVLCAAMVAAIVGALVFFREKKIADALEFCKNQPAMAILIVLSLVPALIFALGRKREIK